MIEFEKDAPEIDLDRYFPVGEEPSQLVLDFGNRNLLWQFVDLAKKSGDLSAEAVAARDLYLRDIEAKFDEAIERVSDLKEKRALEVNRQILPQICLAVALFDAMRDKEADEVLNKAKTALESIIVEDNIVHKDYFKSLLGIIDENIC